MGTIDERRMKNGQISFRARVRRIGSNPVTGTFPTRRQAQEWIRLHEATLVRNKYFPTQKVLDRTRENVGNVIDRYLTSIMPQKKLKTQIHQIQQLHWWKAEIGSLRLDEITSSLLSEKRDKLAQQKPGASTVRRYLFALSHVFSICIKEWELMDSNPVMKISKPREPRGRTRFLSAEERERLLSACADSPTRFLSTIVRLALSTGGRKGELLRLKWSDFLQKTDYLEVIFRDTKNEETRKVPLTHVPLYLLQQRNKWSQFVFPSRKGDKPADIRGAWEAARKRAGLNDFRFHDLRHTFASYLAMNGASLVEIAELLGHKKLEMVKRYAHLTEDHKKAVVERMNKSLFSEGEETA